jgi:Ni,Fe-hydrogenase III large subunit
MAASSIANKSQVDRPSGQMPLVRNGSAIPLADVPHLEFASFQEQLNLAVRQGGLLSALFVVPGQPSHQMIAVCSFAASGLISVMQTEVKEAYPSLSCDIAQAHWFEREIAEQWGIVPEGHPWLKPIRFHASYRTGHDAWNRSSENIRPGVSTTYQFESDQTHEVAVGPIHAGVIEPGHFRFQCHGEHVFHMETWLGYQHRGVERHLVGGPTKRTLPYMETLAGDTSIGHGLAYCQAVEALAGLRVPLRGQLLRGIALELERLANHTGDLGALALDVGYLPTSSYCGRIRGDFLNATALICGNRFGRNLVCPGGTLWDLSCAQLQTLKERVSPALRDVDGAIDLLWKCPSAQARFEGCGEVTYGQAVDAGLVGMAARASGVDRDARRDFPTGIYRFSHIPVSIWGSGDVFGRASVRWLEIQRAGQFVIEQLDAFPMGPVRAKVGSLQPSSIAVSIVEGWRGEICHVAITDEAGKFSHYKVVDPSFHNWFGLMLAMRDQQISDFPVNNKSFNLSYCGHDL